MERHSREDVEAMGVDALRAEIARLRNTPNVEDVLPEYARLLREEAASLREELARARSDKDFLLSQLQARGPLQATAEYSYSETDTSVTTDSEGHQAGLRRHASVADLYTSVVSSLPAHSLPSGDSSGHTTESQLKEDEDLRTVEEAGKEGLATAGAVPSAAVFGASAAVVGMGLGAHTVTPPEKGLVGASAAVVGMGLGAHTVTPPEKGLLGASLDEPLDFPDEPDFKDILSSHLERIKFKSLEDILRDVHEIRLDIPKTFSFVVLMLRLILNVSIIIINFVTEHNQRDSSERFNLSQLILYYTEFITVSVLIVCAFVALLYGFVNRDQSQLGFAAYSLSKLLKMLSSFSLLQFIPSTAKAVVYFYRLYDLLKMTQHLDTHVHLLVGCVLIPLGVAYSALGLASFVVKVSQINFIATEDFSVWATDVIRVVTVGAFMNNILSITDIWEIRYDSILTFVFAGKDGALDLREYFALQTFKQELCYQLIEAKGIFRGFILITQMYDTDVQQLVIFEDEPTDHHAEFVEQKAMQLMHRRSFRRKKKV